MHTAANAVAADTTADLSGFLKWVQLGVEISMHLHVIRAIIDNEVP